MDPATILALANLSIKFGVPMVTALFRKNEKGEATIASIILVLDEAEARNAETLRLIAQAEVQG